MDENDFPGVKSISEQIESLSKKKNTHKKVQKNDCKGGGLNVYGQPDRKISAFFDELPYLKCNFQTLVILHLSRNLHHSIHLASKAT